MTIEYENKVLWKMCRTSIGVKGKTMPKVELCEGPQENLISIINSLGSPIDFTRDQFLEMAYAGAAHFGKQLTITDLPTPCPNCGGAIFEYIIDDDNGYQQKICECCKLSGPMASGKEGADKAWNQFFGNKR